MILGIEINYITVGIFLVVCSFFFYILYNYLYNRSKDESETKDKTVIYLYSAIPSIVIGIVSVLLYEKVLKKKMFRKELLQEDFYS